MGLSEGHILVLHSGSGSDEILVCYITHTLEFQDGKCTLLVLVGSRNTSPSGLNLQNLVCVTDSLFWPGLFFGLVSSTDSLL